MEAAMPFGLTSKNKSKITVEKDLTLLSLKSLVIISLSLLHLCWGGANPIYSGFLFKLGLFL